MYGLDSSRPIKTAGCQCMTPAWLHAALFGFEFVNEKHT
jgi:hypothetical protein